MKTPTMPAVTPGLTALLAALAMVGPFSIDTFVKIYFGQE